MTNLTSLFTKPRTMNIGGMDFEVHKLSFENFEHAIAVGEWIGSTPLATLQDAFAICKSDCPVREQLLQLVAGCLGVPDYEKRLTSDDVRQMPILMVAEAVLAIVEDNADFFMERMPGISERLARLTLTGLKLPNSSLGQVTISRASEPTASQS